MRISSPAFTSILTGFNLRTRAVPRARRSHRDRRNPGLAGLGRTDRGTNRQSGKNEGAGQSGDDLRETIGAEHVGLRNLALPPDHPTVMPEIKHGPCQAAEMTEISQFLKEFQAVRH